MFLDFPVQQSLHVSEESSCSTSHAEATVKQLANAWIRIALHNVRSGVMDIRRESGAHGAERVLLIRAIEGGKHGKDVQKQNEEGAWEDDCR